MNNISENYPNIVSERLNKNNIDNYYENFELVDIILDKLFQELKKLT